MKSHMGIHMENENEYEKENESEDRKMTYDEVMGYEQIAKCPRCGSTNCADYDQPYWVRCLDCGFSSMESNDPGKAADAWAKGYCDIDDKASHEGIENFDHDELLDLWWYWVGMEGATDMGMQPEDADWYWDEHPQELKETMQEMSKQFLAYHVGYFTMEDLKPKTIAYTSEELWDKFGTTDLDIINAGNEDYIVLKD